MSDVVSDGQQPSDGRGDGPSDGPGGDVVLVAAVRAGGVERFGDLVARHEERVRAVIARRVRGSGVGGAAEDVIAEAVQHTFFLAFRHLEALAEPLRFSAWLVRIAERVAAEAVRQRARRQRREPNESSAAARSEPVSEPAAADWIWDEVERLAPLLREALVLRYREGLSYAEIADRLGVPHSTVRGRIHEARCALRRRTEGLL